LTQNFRADGVWNTQLNGFWLAILGPGRDQLEIAFANYRFWVSFGLALGFLLIRLTTIDNFLLIAFFFLFVGILGYFLVELFDIIMVNKIYAKIMYVLFYRFV